MKKTILIADDDPRIRDLVKMILQPEGYTLYEAGDGLQALKLAKQIKPDLMLLDVVMPGLVGYYVCRALKNDPATRNIYVMFLTGRADLDALAAVKRNGGDELLGKPFQVGVLLAKIRMALAGTQVVSLTRADQEFPLAKASNG